MEWDEYDPEELAEALGDPFGPYPTGFMHGEDYTGRPLDKSSTRVGETHHEECAAPFSYVEGCTCKALYERDYEVRTEQELEEAHTEFWQ
jgi:hypothetical protein